MLCVPIFWGLIVTDLDEIEHWVCPDLLFNDGRLQPDQALGLVGDMISTVVQITSLPEQARTHHLAGTISPGFVDLQVNGGGGVLLNSTPTREGMYAMADAHRKFGTTSIMPTVITDAPHVIEHAVEAVIGAVDTDGICGLHIEGPHISVDRRGTHKAEYVRPMDRDTMDQVARLRAAGVPTMITLAPELVPPDDIADLARMGAVVSIGHSKADSRTVETAIAAGAGCFTHLFNAMSHMTGREPGVVGAAINSSAYVGIICDGIHVSDDMVGLALRARPDPDLSFLVSDAMPTVGGPLEFDLYGNTIRLHQNRLINDEGSLAGAHVTMAESVARLVRSVGVTPEAALRMAITVPSAVMGLNRGRISGCKSSDLLCLGADLMFEGYLSDALAA